MERRLIHVRSVAYRGGNDFTPCIKNLYSAETSFRARCTTSLQLINVARPVARPAVSKVHRTHSTLASALHADLSFIYYSSKSAVKCEISIDCLNVKSIKVRKTEMPAQLSPKLIAFLNNYPVLSLLVLLVSKIKCPFSISNSDVYSAWKLQQLIISIFTLARVI